MYRIGFCTALAKIMEGTTTNSSFTLWRRLKWVPTLQINLPVWRMRRLKGAFAQLREQNPRYPTEIGTFLLRPCNRGRQHTAQAQFFVPVVWFVLISMLKQFSSKNIEYKYSKSRNYYRNATLDFLGVLVRV